jgi:hypothetical protein
MKFQIDPLPVERPLFRAVVPSASGNGASGGWLAFFWSPVGSTLQHGDVRVREFEFDPNLFADFGWCVVGGPAFDSVEVGFRCRHDFDVIEAAPRKNRR